MFRRICRPPCQKRMLLLGLPAWGVKFPFHALALVSGLIQRAGWSCRAADLNIRLYRAADEKEREYWSDDNCGVWQQPRLMEQLFAKYRGVVESALAELFAEGPYDLVGFSVNSFNRFFTRKAVEIVRRATDSPILFGGVDCFPREHGLRFFAETTPPDIILQGEAESALPDYLRAVAASGGELRQPVAGFAYREGGLLRQWLRRPRILDYGEPELPGLEDFDVVPDWSQFDHSEYTHPGAFQTFASRGCINRCKFCSESPNFKRFRFRKAEHVVEEIRQVMQVTGRYNPHPFIHFADSLLTANVEQLTRFCDLLLDAGLEVQWGGQAYFREELTAGLLERMHQSGCRNLFWGFESASQHVVDLMGKRYRQEVARRILADCRRIGIQSVLPIIVGFPGERVADLLDTVEFILTRPWAGTFLGPNNCLVRPNSALHEHYRKFGLAGNDYYAWSTIDGRNTFSTRWFRVFLVRNARLNAALRLDEAVMLDDPTFAAVDFDDPAVASEIAGVLYQLAARNGQPRRALDFLGAEEDGKPDIEPHGATSDPPWQPEGVPASVVLRDWFARGKNKPRRRLEIIGQVFEEMRILRGQRSTQPGDESRGLRAEAA